jgi:2-amino-4-hydroxy-6-hydroxymethyldihydropteridine diphosphokinase
MPRVFVSIGSNIEQTRHLLSCLRALEQHFGMLELSSVYESEAIGFDGDNFYNLVAGFECSLSVAELSALLRCIESENGRRRGGPRFSARTLDIDILTYGDQTGLIDGVALPRQEITENAFVLLPLAELAPDSRHPSNGKTYRTLWREFDQSSQKLWPIPFDWTPERRED